MSYSALIHAEATTLIGRGLDAREDEFHGIYHLILTHWFPENLGYIPAAQVLGAGGKPEYVVIHRTGHLLGTRNIVLISELKRPAKWTEAGRREVIDDLVNYIEGRFDLTQHDTIYGLGGIGLHWFVCRMRKSGSSWPTVVLDWQDDITSDGSFAQFGAIANAVYNIH